jgi:DNA methyltransferase 1-associated protein 1
MASSADVRDILSLPASSSALLPTAKKIVASAPTRKPDGISREVYALIGDNSPALVQSYAAPKLKQKPTFGKSQVETPKEEEKPATKWYVFVR